MLKKGTACRLNKIYIFAYRVKVARSHHATVAIYIINLKVAHDTEKVHKDMNANINKNNAFYKDITFENTNLENSVFINCEFENVLFKNINFSKTIFHNCNFKHVCIKKSTINSSMFISCNIESVLVEFCEAEPAKFINCNINNVNSRMNSFLSSKLKNCKTENISVYKTDTTNIEIK